VSYTLFLYSLAVCTSWHADSHLYFTFPRSYTDPVDGSKAENQGLILSFKYPNGNSARVVFRLSGTGSAGATVRVYLERFEKDVAKHGESAPVALKSLADRAVRLVKMSELTGRDSPTVIT
jgi:phosphoglucomutase